MAAEEEKRGVHPERSAAVGEQDSELGKINGHVVDVNGVAVFVAGSGENRGSGVKHDGDAIGLSGAIDDFEFVHAAEVIVRKKQLMRGMDLDHSNAEAEKLLDIGHDVRSVARMQAAAGDQPLRIFLGVVGDELIDTTREADDFGRDVVDEHRAIDAGFVEVLKKGLRRAAEFDDLIVIRALLLHQFKCFGLEHLDRLDMDVAVGDHWGLVSRSIRPRCAKQYREVGELV